MKSSIIAFTIATSLSITLPAHASCKDSLSYIDLGQGCQDATVLSDLGAASRSREAAEAQNNPAVVTRVLLRNIYNGKSTMDNVVSTADRYNKLEGQLYNRGARPILVTGIYYELSTGNNVIHSDRAIPSNGGVILPGQSIEFSDLLPRKIPSMEIRIYRLQWIYR